MPFWQLPLKANRLLWIGLGTELLLIANIIYTPFLAAIFMVQPLTVHDWSLLTLCPIIMVLIEELRRYLCQRLWSHSTNQNR
ncbi:cation transporting ATPase C-terminal domain-containing protein [Sporomusa silvacetica]|uniref:cation transporting ATPase C-terminal domain-containing protein n=1 Tax=Sporomusa silvacetica TaxID=55504 RepID=UPI00146DFF6E